MSRHRAAPPQSPGVPLSRHRAPVRPRYGRITVLGAAVTVTGVALLGGVGVVGGEAAQADRASGALDRVAFVKPVVRAGQTKQTQQTQPAEPTTTPTPTADPTPISTPTTATSSPSPDPTSSSTPVGPLLDNALPADSGEGERVVFSQSRQRVWLVDSPDDQDKVRTSYLVSGSVTDNLDPGTYEVYSRSEKAYGVEDSGTMNYFVRFAHGDTGASIGFHDIPEKDGVKLQTQAQLGTPQSHGCIRQRTKDALSLWKFAPLGTTVVVVA